MGILSVMGGVMSKAGSILAYVPTAILFVEKLGEILVRLTGNKIPSGVKQSLASEMVKDFILTSEIVVGKEILDEEKFAKYLNQVIDGMVGLMNTVKEK
jgi:hypothetical protein